MWNNDLKRFLSKICLAVLALCLTGGGGIFLASCKATGSSAENTYTTVDESQWNIEDFGTNDPNEITEIIVGNSDAWLALNDKIEDSKNYIIRISGDFEAGDRFSGSSCNANVSFRGNGTIRALYGRLIDSYNATVVLRGPTIMQASGAVLDFPIIELYRSTFIIHDCKIINFNLDYPLIKCNTSVNTMVKMYGGEISNNNCQVVDGNMSMYGGEIKNNDVGVYLRERTFIKSGGTMSGNGVNVQIYGGKCIYADLGPTDNVNSEGDLSSPPWEDAH